MSWFSNLRETPGPSFLSSPAGVTSRVTAVTSRASRVLRGYLNIGLLSSAVMAGTEVNYFSPFLTGRSNSRLKCLLNIITKTSARTPFQSFHAEVKF